MKFLQAGALLATLLLSACSESSQTFLIDNPTDAPLALSVDGQAHTIPANASSELKLAPGAHALHSEQLGDVRFIVYAGGKGALINPTLSDYVIANQIYVTDESKLDNFMELQHTVTLDGVEFTGPFKQSHDLFIAQDWDFGLRKPFPETQVTMDVPKSGAISIPRSSPRPNSSSITKPNTTSLATSPASARAVSCSPGTRWSGHRPHCRYWSRNTKPTLAHCAMCMPVT